MKERPIIFSSEMVKAILEGRKTETRRIIKFPKVNPYIFKKIKVEKDKSIDLFELCPHGYIKIGNLKCPYGQPGDRLWVRETYSISGNGVFYKIDTDGTVHIAWMPAIFMPRKYSRITLEITDIRVERLQEISPEECNKEGIEGILSAKDSFFDLWNSINKTHPWETNPWVWVISFKRLNSH